jgi:hypothetical protein
VNSSLYQHGLETKGSRTIEKGRRYDAGDGDGILAPQDERSAGAGGSVAKSSAKRITGPTRE